MTLIKNLKFFYLFVTLKQGFPNRGRLRLTHQFYTTCLHAYALHDIIPQQLQSMKIRFGNKRSLNLHEPLVINLLPK